MQEYTKEQSKVMAMTDSYEIDLSKVSANTPEDVTHWIALLDTVVRYHRDMAEAMKEVVFETEEDDVVKIHEAWANGIADAAVLINFMNKEGKKTKEFVVGVD